MARLLTQALHHARGHGREELAAEWGGERRGPETGRQRGRSRHDCPSATAHTVRGAGAARGARLRPPDLAFCRHSSATMSHVSTCQGCMPGTTGATVEGSGARDGAGEGGKTSSALRLQQTAAHRHYHAAPGCAAGQPPLHLRGFGGVHAHSGVVGVQPQVLDVACRKDLGWSCKRVA